MSGGIPGAPRKGVSLLFVINLSLLAGLVVAGFFVYSYLQRRPPTPVQAVFTSVARVSNAPPMWKRDIYGPESSPLNSPMGLSVAPDGTIYVADTGNARIQVFAPDGKWLRRFGEPGGSAGKLFYPIDVLVRNGKVYVADMKNMRIDIFTPQGDYLGTIPDAQRHKDLKVAPLALAADGAGNMYVTTLQHEVLVFGPDDSFVKRIGRPGTADGELQYPNGVVVDRQGNVWVADSNNSRVQAFDPSGKLLHKTMEFATPRGMALFEDKVLVVDVLQHTVHALNLEGRRVFTFGTRGMGDGQFNFPNDVAVDPGTGRIYVVDRENNRVSVWAY